MTNSSVGKAINLLEMADVLAKRLPSLPAHERIAMLIALFGSKTVLTTSFGATSAALLHIVSRITTDITVLNIRHGHETQETLAFIEHCERQFPINLHTEKAPYLPIPKVGSKQFDEFRQATKVAPLRSALSELDVWFWLSGVMHDETESRKNLEMARVRHGVIVVYPILDWTSADALNYCIKHNLPINNHYFDPCKGPEQSLECGLHYDASSAR